MSLIISLTPKQLSGQSLQRSASLWERITRLLKLPQTPHSEQELAQAVAQGLPPTVVEQLLEAGLSRAELHQLVLPQRTLSHRIHKGQPLAQIEADRAVRVAWLLALAEQVFGDNDKALHWLRAPKTKFAGKSPLDLMTTELSAKLVEEELIRIDEGYFA